MQQRAWNLMILIIYSDIDFDFSFIVKLTFAAEL